MGVLLLTLFGLVAYGVWYGTRHPSVTFETVEVSGGTTVSHDEVGQAVWRALSGNHFLLIAKRFIYIYPHDAVVAEVSNIPRVYDVDVSQEGKTLLVHFEEYIPEALWCSGVPEDSSCVFITEDGYGFSEAPQLHGGVFVRFIQQGVTSTPQTIAFTADEMIRMQALIKGFAEDFNYDVESVVITKDNDEEYRLARGSTLLVAQSDSEDKVLGKLHSIFTSPDFTHLTTETFNYIDLRFGNRVFVKESFDEVEVVEDTEADLPTEE